MRLTGRALLVAALCIGLLAGCAKPKEKVFTDGTYKAEFAEFDSYGYKDFVEVKVESGVVTDIRYNGMNAEGHLKTEDLNYESDMQSLQDTWPVKYTTDLQNQYLEKQGIAGVDALAGATYSSDSFTALMTALEDAMVEGNTETLVVENVPVK